MEVCLQALNIDGGGRAVGGRLGEGGKGKRESSKVTEHRDRRYRFFPYVVKKMKSKRDW